MISPVFLYFPIILSFLIVLDSFNITYFILNILFLLSSLVKFKLDLKYQFIKDIMRIILPFLLIYSVFYAFISSETFRSVEFATLLLGFLTTLKLCEWKSENDLKSIFLINTLFLASAILLSDQIYSIFILLFVSFYYLYLLGIVNHYQFNLKTSYKSIFLSLLFVGSLYLVIPQLGIGGVFTFKNARTTSGIADELSPGTFLRMLEDNSIHYVINAKNHDSYNDFYWRVYTLKNTDGKNWFGLDERVKNVNIEEEYDLKIVKVVQKPMPSLKNRKFDLINFKNTPSKSNLFYYKDNLGKSLSLQEKLSSDKIQAYLKVKNISPRLKEFVEDIKNARNKKNLPLNANEKFQLLIKKMGRLQLSYSLSNNVITSNDISSFLFESKSGYCEHFASATAILLRLLDIPSRLNVGYYGGRFDTASNLLYLTGENAHAWIEYYDGENWIFADPLELILTNQFLPENSFVNNRFLAEDINIYSSFIQDLKLLYLSLNYKFFSYDAEAQIEFFTTLKNDFRNYIIYIQKNIFPGVVLFVIFCFSLLSLSNYFLSKFLKRLFNISENGSYFIFKNSVLREIIPNNFDIITTKMHFDPSYRISLYDYLLLIYYRFFIVLKSIKEAIRFL